VRNQIFCAVLLAYSTLAAGEASAAEPASPSDADEVVVTGMRNLQDVRREIARTEERFFKRLNEIVADKDMAIHCRTEAKTGSSVKNRTCEPEFVLEAKESDGRHVVAHLQDMLAGGGGIGYMPLAPGIADGREAEFREKVLKAINADAELRRLVREREALAKQYEKLQTSLSKPPGD
jgi:hypothetical protein